MRKYLIEQLLAHKSHTGQTLKIGIINFGGTIISVPSADPDKLEPVASEQDAVDILLQGSGFGQLVKAGLLELKIIYHQPIDSSQMLDSDREKSIAQLQAAYPHYDGFLVLHGTDTAAETARFVHLTLPYNDPVVYWKEGREVFNWTKPYVICSSQEPAIVRTGDHEYGPNQGSDGDLNLLLGVSIIVEQKVADAGILTNGMHALRGIAAKKVSESHFPPFDCDIGVPKIAERTAFGIKYYEGYLRRIEQNNIPFVILGSGAYQEKVLTINEPAHFSICKLFLAANDAEKESIRKMLPRVLLYGSKGAGNVQAREYLILKEMEQHGVHVCRVPIPGGRIPPVMHYNVPGEDILGLNIDQTTARYKAQAVLALMDTLHIAKEQQSEFFKKMMLFKFGNEFLPTK